MGVIVAAILFLVVVEATTADDTEPLSCNASIPLPKSFVHVENDIFNPKYGSQSIPFPFRVFRDQGLQDQVPSSVPVPEFVRVYEFVKSKEISVSLFELGMSARHVLDANIPSSEAVLFRNLNERIKTASDFAEFWNGVRSPSLPEDKDEWKDMRYNTEKCLERPRLDGVDLSTGVAPPEVLLRLHNEMVYNPRPPTRFGLYCLQDADSGGETMLGLNTEFSRKIPDNMRPFMEASGGVSHERKYFNANHPSEQHPCISWQRKTGATTREEALLFFTEKGWREEDITFNEKGDMSIRFQHSGYIRYNTTGEEVFFNTQQDLPRDMADGSQMPTDLRSQLELAMWKSVRSLRLQPGDWLVADNTRVLHGRYPFKDNLRKQRAMLVVYAESPHHRMYERVMFDESGRSAMNWT